ncbi:uncharacterized protein Tco025E_01634 [Trypanosoma conorhini]|uniref:Uncharacterized protein n=1 Tax=Trypanosoma conorhini TaxID=83891 RepID=A0A3R7LDB3_9TRYP|nr:uncharacterized protein Tco025E_01634 [Trypanosoma conorhini]RNF26105.1 hypothetical protein Tco025E_01634 [Trypanosoma conorhini]
MPTGNGGTLFLPVVRAAAALSGRPCVEQAAANVGRATVSPVQSANALRSPSSSPRPPAPGECHSHPRHEEASWWATALRYKAITTEARQLGLDALQRGELRRRAKVLFSLEKWHAAGCAANAATVVKETLAAILKEEVDGCRGWADVASGGSCHVSFVLGGGDTARVVDAASALAATLRGHGDPTNADCIRRLLCAVAVVSAMLNHFCPLCCAMAASAELPHAWAQALASFEQLLNDEGIVSFVLTEAVVSAVVSANSFPLTILQRCDALLKETRAKMLPCLVPLQRLLEVTDAAAASATAGAPGPALHMRTEAQLLDLKCRLQGELRERLAVALELEQRSVEQAQQFRQAWDLHRMSARDTQSCGPCLRPRKEGFTAGDSSGASAGWRVHSGAPPVVREAAAETKSTVRCETVARGHETAVTASCWERTVLEVWGARREAVLAVLRQHAIADSILLKRDGAAKEAKAKQDVGSAWMADVLPGALSRQLRALIGAPDQHATRLFVSLRRWVRGGRAAPDAEVYVARALELVVFLLVADVTAAQDDTLLPELIELVKHLAGARGQGDASLLPSLRQLPDALAVALVGAVLSLPSTQAALFAEHHSHTEGGRRVLSNVSFLLWELHSACALQHAVSMLGAGRTVPHAAGGGGVIAPPLPSLQGRAAAVRLLADVARRGRGAGLALGPSPTHDAGFTLTLTELLGYGAVAQLQGIPARMRRPLPRFFSEALWEGLLPLATGSLHELQRIHRDCGGDAVRRLLELCRALVEAIAPRWDYSIVPTRRLQRRALTLLASALAGQEYEANDAVKDRVVKFASLLEGLLAGAAAASPHLLPDSRTFSRMCNAVGLILHDVDGRTGHQIMTHLLRLRPPLHTLDTEAHIAIIRCLSSLRHGCTLWEEAVRHYRQAVDFVEDANKHNPVGASHRRPHIPADLSTARLLRCIGSSPLPREARCALTLRVVAFARASGLSLSSQSYSSCLLNFTLRERQCTGAFTGAPWCDALEWYNDAMTRMQQTPPPQQDPLCFQLACLQSLLAQGEWPEALLSIPLADILRRHDDAAEFGLDRFTGKVSFLLRLCASDRTRSCAGAARSLLKVLQPLSSPKPGTQAVNLAEMRHLCRVANTLPPVHAEAKATSGVPLFRHEAPLIPRSPVEMGGAWTHSPGSCALSLRRPCHNQEALLAKLEDTVFLGLHGTPSHASGGVGGDPLRPLAPLQVRERVSRAFPLLKTVWSAEDVLRREAAAAGEGARSRMDTCYASVIVPLRRLERLRAEKRRGMRGRHPAPRLAWGVSGRKGPPKVQE